MLPTFLKRQYNSNINTLSKISTAKDFNGESVIIDRGTSEFKDLAFYVWSASLVLITARACSNAYHANLTLISALALLTAAVAVCIVHFGLGRVVGSFFNEKVNADQRLVLR